MIFSIVFVCPLQIIVYCTYLLYASNEFNVSNTLKESNISNESNKFNAPKVPKMILTYNATKVLMPTCQRYNILSIIYKLSMYIMQTLSYP